jgi:exodeoxyribonuclease VII large subunit
MEDLWAFNDERVARAIFAARRPIISGVGHETDFTIADLVADLRAPTPSAAAELAVPSLEEIRPALDQLQAALTVEMQAIVEQKRWQVQTLARALVHLSPRAALDNNRQRIDGLLARLDRAGQRRLERERGRLAVAQAGLIAVSPLATLSRGYAIVRDEHGRIVRSVQAVASGDKITVQVTDGGFGATVEQEK